MSGIYASYHRSLGKRDVETKHGTSYFQKYLEAKFFLFGSLGYGLDVFASNLVNGGPPPIGVKLAKLNNFVKDVILQFALQEVGHLRAIKNIMRGLLRPLLDLRVKPFSKVMESTIRQPLYPLFDPYANEINFLLASYLIPYVDLTSYVGAIPLLQNATSKKLIAGLLAVESGQDAVIRASLYERRALLVHLYGVGVEVFTERILALRNKLGNAGLKDEGLVVPITKGAEGKVVGNILAGDNDSLAYSRTPQKILRIIFGGGDEHVIGGFYPSGGIGRIARSYINYGDKS
ncbi:hypothetical protein CR513_48234, partial [Mucuna pruriens]